MSEPAVPKPTIPSIPASPVQSESGRHYHHHHHGKRGASTTVKPEPASRLIREVSSEEFLELDEDKSYFQCHPFDVGIASRKPDIPDGQQENLLPKDIFAPFKLMRVVGRLREVPAINLTNGTHKNSVLYASSNAIIHFDFFKNTQRCLQGHKNVITTLVADSSVFHYVSGDSGKDCCMIVWDIANLSPIKLFQSPHDGCGIVNAAFSGAEFLIATIGAEEVGKQKICVWTYDPKETKTPLSSCDLPSEAGYQKAIVFCDMIHNYFATYGDSHMLFHTYNKATQAIYVHKPKVPAKFVARMKRFTGGLWTNEDNWFVTTTMLGYAVVWEKPLGLGLKKPIDRTKNIKEYKRSFKLSDNGITCFNKYKNYLVAGDEKGILRFFDGNFRIVRWTPTIMLSEPITFVSFNVTDAVPDFVSIMHSHYTGGRSHVHHEGNSAVKDYTFGGQKKRPLSETSIERNPLIVPDFILCTDSGSLHYCHFMKARVDLLVPGAPAPWIAIDVCPNTSHIAFVTRVGEVQMYDYSLHKMTYNRKVFRKQVSITVMKFHPLGELLFFGTADGYIYLRHNYTFLNVQSPLVSGTAAIYKMTFSVDGSFMACCDTNGLVALYHFDAHKGLWTNFGKNIPHTKEVVDLQFCVDKVTNCSRFFSLGADRRLIEYNLYDYGSGIISILKTFYVEQTCIPTCMTFVCPEEFGDHVVLIHNKINKFRVFDYEQGKVMKTCQGPLFGGEKIQKLLPFSPTARKLNTNQRIRHHIIFWVDNKLGLVTTPVDGNPNRYMAVLAHPEDMLDVCISPNQQYVITIGKNDKCVYFWESAITSAEAGVLLGGAGTVPFTHILKQHWPQQDIVKDIDMIVFHLNLKRVQTQSEMISMPKTVRLNEMAAVCRTCGFFLTEYEIDVMLTEAIFMIHLRSGNDDQITFDEFIKMFANHFYRTSHDDVQWAFSVLGKNVEEEGLFIPGEWFLHYMCGRGEPMPREDFDELFSRLLKKVQLAQPKSRVSSADVKATVPSLPGMKRRQMSLKSVYAEPTQGTIWQQPEPDVIVGEDGEVMSADKDEKSKGLSNDASSLQVPRRIDLLKFLDTMFPLYCQDAMRVEAKEKDENKELQKLTYGKMYKSQNAKARMLARQNQRFFQEKTKCLLNPDNPLYDKLLCAFEAQIFQLTGKTVNREEIIAGARAYLNEKGPLRDDRKKKGSKGSADSDSDTDSSKKLSDLGDDLHGEGEMQEEVMEEFGEEESEKVAEEELEGVDEEMGMSVGDEENLFDMEEGEEHVQFNDPMNIITTEDETWLNEDIDEGTHDELEPVPKLEKFGLGKPGHPDEYLSAPDLSHTEEET